MTLNGGYDLGRIAEAAAIFLGEEPSPDYEGEISPQVLDAFSREVSVFYDASRARNSNIADRARRLHKIISAPNRKKNLLQEASQEEERVA